MVKFRRRNIGCWDRSPPDFVDRMQGLSLLEFESKKKVIEYIKESLPFVLEYPEKYKLRIKDRVVIAWTVLGWIIEEGDEG